MPDEITPLNDHTPGRVLAVMPHPDDTEFFCGGTLALWASRGAEVYICMVTDGSKGSDDPEMTAERLIAIRQEEQRASARVLGAQDTFFLGVPDGEVVPDPALRKRIVRLIRQLKPDALVCPDPSVIYYGDYINHPDHRAVGEAALYAFQPAANNRFFFPDLLAEGLEPHQLKEVYLAGAKEPNVEIDTTAALDTQIAALREHRSQLPNMDELEKEFRAGGETLPDGSKRYTEKLRRFVFGPNG